MPSLLLKGARVIDPVARYDQIANVLIAHGVIRQVGTDLRPEEGAIVVDLSGAV